MTDRVRSVSLYLLVALPVLVSLLIAPEALAAGGGQDLILNQIFDRILEWLSGRLAIVLGAIAFAIAGIIWMFFRHEKGADAAIRACVGAAAAVSAASLIQYFVGQGALL